MFNPQWDRLRGKLRKDTKSYSGIYWKKNVVMNYKTWVMSI